jgi:predicted SprT family Zn-dependent metalloprotease
MSGSGGTNETPAPIRAVLDEVDDVVPESVTKRRGRGKLSSRRQSIHQSPARQIIFPSASAFAPLSFAPRHQPPEGSSVSNTPPRFLDLTQEEAWAEVEERPKRSEQQRLTSEAPPAAGANAGRIAGAEETDSPELVIPSRTQGRGRSAFIICDSSSSSSSPSSSPSSASSADEGVKRSAAVRSSSGSRSKGVVGRERSEYAPDKENLSANAKRVVEMHQRRSSTGADADADADELVDSEDLSEESVSESESEVSYESEDWGVAHTPHKPSPSPLTQSRRAYSTAGASASSPPRPALSPRKATARASQQSASPSVAPAATGSAAARFRRDREALTATHFNAFNEIAFKGKLPSPTIAAGELQVKWNKRLLTTAGITKLKLTTTTTRIRRGSASGDSSAGDSPARPSTQPKPKPEQVRSATIELSEKVVDNEDRLKATLLHEMCHAAAWLLDSERKPPHGPAFWKYADIAQSALPGIAVSTCHSYAIHKPFKFRCTNASCGQEYSRHSKSIDLDAKCCGVCKSKLTFVGTFNADGTPKKARPVTAFSLFVQEHFASVKAGKSKRSSSGGGGKKAKSHQEVMQELAAMYSAQKMREATATDTDTQAQRVDAQRTPSDVDADGQNAGGGGEDDALSLSLALGDLQLCVGVNE